MAVQIIDAFKFIEVNKCQRQAFTWLLAVNHFADQFLNVKTIRQAGQFIMIGTIAQCFLTGFQFFRQLFEAMTFRFVQAGLSGGECVRGEQGKFACQGDMVAVKPGFMIVSQ